MNKVLPRVLALLALAPLGVADASDANEPGRQLFKSTTPPCALCHTLADAGATGNIGPSLDERHREAKVRQTP